MTLVWPPWPAFFVSVFMVASFSAAFGDYYLFIGPIWVQFRQNPGHSNTSNTSNTSYHMLQMPHMPIVGNPDELPTLSTPSLLETKVGLNLPSFDGEVPCLKFIHIPKTGGTKISMQALDHKIRWGQYETSLKCSDKRNCTDFAAKRECCYSQQEASQAQHRCSIWHMPPAEDSLIAESYAGCQTFCVVRNPFSRFISEFRWHMIYWTPREPGQGFNLTTLCSHDVFMKYSKERMQQDAAAVLDFTDDCHRMPQSKYVISDDKKHSYCNHVIRFENLTEEFNTLIKAYNLSVRLDTRKINSFEQLCQIELSQELKIWIYNRYQLDFKRFGYTYGSAG